MLDPKLRSADKVKPPYPLGRFPRKTILNIASEIVYLVFTRNSTDFEGKDWESVFAASIGATWAPSNIGLDDVQLGGCCWGAKTVKSSHPSNAQRVRLISGRNSLDYSYNISDMRSIDPDKVGQHVLGIWNQRVSSVRERFSHCRSVVLIKSQSLSECALFEFETIRYDYEQYVWSWNTNHNLVGHTQNGDVRFTWQPHGSQFTIIENVPPNRTAFRIQLPAGRLSKESALAELGFDDTWVTLI